MPVETCGESYVLTGQDGLISMRPPGTQACLLDNTDFSAGSAITIPATSDFRVGDPVMFHERGTANLDSALTEAVLYYIKARTGTTVQVSATQGGAAITMTGDGGTGTDDTPGADNHIELSYAADHAMCEVPSVTLELTRNEIDKTAIPCKPAASPTGPRMAPFRTFQGGFVDGSGTLTMRLVADRASFNNRILQGALFSNQSGAMLTAYFSATAATGGGIDNAKSLYSEFPITLLGFSTGLSSDDSPTEVSMNFRISGQPSHLFGLTP